MLIAEVPASDLLTPVYFCYFWPPSSIAMDMFTAYRRTKVRVEYFLEDKSHKLNLHEQLVYLDPSNEHNQEKQNNEISSQKFPIDILLRSIFTKKSKEEMDSSVNEYFQNITENVINPNSIRSTDSPIWWIKTSEWLKKSTNNKCFFALEIETDLYWIHLFRYSNTKGIHNFRGMNMCKYCKENNKMEYAYLRCCKKKTYCSEKCHLADWKRGHSIGHPIVYPLVHQYRTTQR